MPKHLLIADDEPSILAVLRIFFERQGYRVSCARHGQVALDLARQDPPDLMIIDIQMPVKDGIAVIAELRADARFASTPAIALTGFSREFVPSTLLQAGFTHALAKPLEFSELRAVVNSLIGGAGAPRALTI